jgi:hypothetical protein
MTGFIGVVLLWSFAIYGLIYFVKDNFSDMCDFIYKICKHMCDFCGKFIAKKNR